MAKVTCTLKYEQNKLTKTYHVTFDPNDTIEVVTETQGLAIKASNERANDLVPALTKGSTVEVGPLALAPKTALSAPKREFHFFADPAQVAKFQCGVLKSGVFTPYPDVGPEFP